MALQSPNEQKHVPEKLPQPATPTMLAAAAEDLVIVAWWRNGTNT